jgi:hypothetical protein
VASLCIHAPRARASAGDLLHGLQHARLVVGPDRRHKRGVIAQRRRNVVDGHATAAPHAHMRDRDAPRREVGERGVDRRVLDRGRDHVAPAVGARCHGRERGVVRLGRAGREHDLGGRHREQLRDALARAIELCARGTALRVHSSTDCPARRAGSAPSPRTLRRARA